MAQLLRWFIPAAARSSRISHRQGIVRNGRLDQRSPFSPRGDRIAIIDHPLLGDDGGIVSVVDLSGKKSDLTERWASAIGLAWSPSGDEIWFTATATGFSRSLRGVTLSGKVRELLTAPGTLTLHDTGAGGRALISRDALRAGAVGLVPGETKERDLAGRIRRCPQHYPKMVKFSSSLRPEKPAGGDYAVFVRETTGTSAVRLGEGSSRALSPDGKWALVQRQSMSPPDFVLLPTGVGHSARCQREILFPGDGRFLPDSRRLVFEGHEANRGGGFF